MDSMIDERGVSVMAKALEGKRIVITGSRKLSELSEIIDRQGGDPLVRSQQGTLLPAEEEVERDLNHLVESGTDWIIFTTGTGLVIVPESERMGAMIIELSHYYKNQTSLTR
ncbi:hypothetical protein [Paenibacillus sp. LHD-38]|uniref:hypothetical protein n=1 Tax=Paenibacillus sp. LHD-38 TaxID=3072143 RepID=UPI00280D49B7|nr:hypothetical protein [Paenibacillus sp. LHD-38]MDQ8735634.1 hypothetical protein [Paenibacillus sp. LHD-38]